MKTFARYCLKPRLFKFWLLIFLSLAILQNYSNPKEVDILVAGFKEPPRSAKPRVWWHWMNGNVTKEGIKADLLWMDRIGIGGFQNFDAALMTPKIVDKRLVYMTPEWKDAFLYTTELADYLKLEMAIAGSPGWSESGGPWVQPKDGMKKYVWSEIRVKGGKEFIGTIPRPPSTTGTFQNFPVEHGLSLTEETPEPPEYYQDIGVYAYRIPDADVSMEEINPKITSSGGSFDLTTLIDGDVDKTILLPAVEKGEKSWVQFEFDKPQTVKSLTIVGGGGNTSFPSSGRGAAIRALEAGDDGINFRVVVSIPAGGNVQNTLAFEPVTAKYFRFTFIENPSTMNISSFLGLEENEPSKLKGIPIAELVLHTVTRVNRFEAKAAFSVETGLAGMATPEADTSEVIYRNDIIDLTSKLDNDGSLKWFVPEGQWIISRLGHSLTGRQNHPASLEATGLEVDKLDPEAVRAYFSNYLDQYKDATGGLMGERGLQYIITDSWEAGTANWTGNMMKEFSRRRGYEMQPWLPVLFGRIVESSEASDRFLWDFRITLGEMLAEFHYDNLTELLNERSMGRYSESHESGRAFIGDGMDVKRSAHIPMSATWTPGGFSGPEEAGVAVLHRADVRESASVAHIYGQNIVAAESMTAIGNTWAYSPERLKPTADMELASGLNRFVIHTSVHQPVDDKIPGLGLGPFGQWFTRHETWAEQAGPWISYLARSSYMLQQGQFVADVLYVYGEDNNITALFRERLPDIPEGYNYDFINADAIRKVLSFENNMLMTPGGTSYRLLALDSSTQYMTLPVLKKIKELVYNGAIVTGAKPVNTPSLSDDEKEFRAIADELWKNGTGVNSLGKGKVYGGKNISQVLEELGINQDFSYTRPKNDTEVLFVHRKINDTDVYWVNNRNNRFEDIDATFRVSGKAPELWNPETGNISEVSYKIENGRTTVSLKLKPNDAIFIVFRNRTDKLLRESRIKDKKQLTVLEGTWDVSFQPDRGAPEKIVMEKLGSWSENEDTGVKYFSGTATYSKSIQVPRQWIQSAGNIVLELGEVKNIAEVIINGESIGILWKTPFRVDITDSLIEGENRLEIKVTNLWVNRLIGDQRPGIKKTYTYTTQPFYRAGSPLLPSGLLGPVTINRVD
jgi:hypothetical protein